MKPLFAAVLLLLATDTLAQTASAPVPASLPQPVPLPRPRPQIAVEPRSFAEAAAAIQYDVSTFSPGLSECRQRLDAVAVVEALPRLIGPGACGNSDMVRLKSIKLADKTEIPMTPAPNVRCEMAEAVAGWVREEVAPQFRAQGFRGIENYDSFECRGRNRVVGAKLSEHGKGNALDVRYFKLADGKTFDPTDIHASKEMREAAKAAACRRFTTVLGPGSDGYHESHIHLDIAERRGGYRLCQWAVREPPPPPPPPPPAGPPLPPEASVAPPAADDDDDEVKMTMDAKIAAGEVPLPKPRPRRLSRIR